MNRIHIDEDNMLIISDLKTGAEITRHELSNEKGKLIKSKNHGRDRSKGVPEYMGKVADELGNTPEARDFLEGIRALKPRYITCPPGNT